MSTHNSDVWCMVKGVKKQPLSCVYLNYIQILVIKFYSILHANLMIQTPKKVASQIKII